jgi:hypothetical protein
VRAERRNAAPWENPLAPFFLASLLSLPLWAGIVYVATR